MDLEKLLKILNLVYGKNATTNGYMMNGLTSMTGLNTYVNLSDASVIVIGILNGKFRHLNRKKIYKIFYRFFCHF